MTTQHEPVVAMPPTAAASPPPRKSPRLGEELPIFCERCGYSLFGLPQIRCSTCRLLHFSCPECNHHQSINTLRPAAQRILGRLRALALSVSVLFRIALFGGGLLSWFAMGNEWGYGYNYYRVAGSNMPYLTPSHVSEEMIWAFGLLGLVTGLVCRMFLLRWASGLRVGLVLGAVIILAVLAGLLVRRYSVTPAAPPPTLEFYSMAFLGAISALAGAGVAWPIWAGLVALFLPRGAAQQLLQWQKSQAESVAGLAR